MAIRLARQAFQPGTPTWRLRRSAFQPGPAGQSRLNLSNRANWGRQPSRRAASPRKVHASFQRKLLTGAQAGGSTPSCRTRPGSVTRYLTASVAYNAVLAAPVAVASHQPWQGTASRVASRSASVPAQGRTLSISAAVASSSRPSLRVTSAFGFFASRGVAPLAGLTGGRIKTKRRRSVRRREVRDRVGRGQASQPWRFLRLTNCAASGTLGDFMFGPSHSMRRPSPTRKATQPSRMISVR